MKTTLTIEQSAELIKRGVSAEKASMSNATMQAAVDARGIVRIPRQPIFTLADLLSLLPKEITVTMESYDVDRLACLHISSTNEKWYVSYKYEFEEREYWCKMFNSEELIDALYKLMIWAIAHNHVKLD